jgi:hypothetical protein
VETVGEEEEEVQVAVVTMIAALLQRLLQRTASPVQSQAELRFPLAQHRRAQRALPSDWLAG